MRWVSTRVLPEPAPATMSSGDPSCRTASRCCGLRPSSRAATRLLRAASLAARVSARSADGVALPSGALPGEPDAGTRIARPPVASPRPRIGRRDAGQGEVVEEGAHLASQRTSRHRHRGATTPRDLGGWHRVGSPYWRRDRSGRNGRAHRRPAARRTTAGRLAGRPGRRGPRRRPPRHAVLRHARPVRRPRRRGARRPAGSPDAGPATRGRTRTRAARWGTSRRTSRRSWTTSAWTGSP